MKTILGFVGCCLSIAAASLQASAAVDTSAHADQSEIASVGDAQLHHREVNRAGRANGAPVEGSSSAASADLTKSCAGPALLDGSFSNRGCLPQPDGCPPQLPSTLREKTEEDSTVQPSNATPRAAQPTDFNRNIYYKNKLEFSLEGAWLPINIPFPLDVFEGDPYNLYPLRYTLVPILASLRWHLGDIGGPRILRGNWDLTFTGSFTAIPKGPETRYLSYIMGIRRNFVPHNWRVVPFADIRLGLGDINAKGSKVQYAQGQDFTFTAQMGSGVRYNFNPRYAISGGLNYMHISNAGLSGKSHNYGINVYGPMFGIDVQLGRRLRHSE